MTNLNMFSLEGRTALVTGANTGLGQGICVAYARAGANVIGVARRSCQETADKIAAFGGSFREVIADLSDTSVIPHVVEEAEKAFGRVDILVNNAGIIKRCDAADVTEEDWDAVININEKMVFFLCQAFARKWLADQKGGKIINIASMLSYQGGIRVPAYTSSKSAIVGLTRELANEWAKHNINVNAIAPGLTDTDMGGITSEEVKAIAMSRNVMKRLGKPEEIADAAVFLASELSRFMTGQTLRVDGGLL